LLIHGVNDTQAPATAAQAFAAGLQRAGDRVELQLLPGQDHVSVLQWSAAYLPTWIANH
jgi:dipeptidyl aminopeptidase/acylaminoacyl peptidase